MSESDLGAVLPLGRQHSLLNLITVVMQKLGHLIHVYLPRLLQILLCITASVSSILDHREQVTKSQCYPARNTEKCFYDTFFVIKTLPKWLILPLKTSH